MLLKENTIELLERTRHISGKEEDVDRITANLNCIRSEKMGRSKGATVLLNPGETLSASTEVSVQPMTLQQVFVAMCGREV